MILAPRPPKDGLALCSTYEVFAALDTGGSTSVEPQFPHIGWEKVWAESPDCHLHLLGPETWLCTSPGYPMMAAALNATGRPIAFSCSWPAYEGGLPPKVSHSMCLPGPVLPTWPPHLLCRVGAVLTVVAHLADLWVLRKGPKCPRGGLSQPRVLEKRRHLVGGLKAQEPHVMCRPTAAIKWSESGVY